MLYDLSDFAPANVENAGGICSFEFLPKDYLIDDVVLSIQSNQAFGSINTLQPWYQGRAANQSAGFTEVPKTTPSGIVYEQKVRFQVNKDTPDINTLMNALHYREYVVIYTDRNGQRKIIGNKTKGMKALVELNIGAAFLDRNYFTIELSLESDHPAPFYP